MKFTVEDEFLAKETQSNDYVSVNFEERTSLINLEYFDQHEFIHFSIQEAVYVEDVLLSGAIKRGVYARDKQEIIELLEEEDAEDVDSTLALEELLARLRAR